MVSTVTTSTVSVVSTIAIAGSFAVVGIIVLLVLLVQKELYSSSDSERAKRLSRALNIGIVPLFIAFVMIVISKVIGILN